MESEENTVSSPIPNMAAAENSRKLLKKIEIGFYAKMCIHYPY